MSLYRKYRPQKFMDIVGQEHVKKVLTNAVGQGKISHAYLFSGPRGTGKTTMARLLAKALNCQDRNRRRKTEDERQKTKDKAVLSSKSLVLSSFEPCNECINCVEVTGDRSMDVIEIDAASNRGIDEIRELRDKVRYAPSNSAYKVYIIDEVHMLTKEAFNALLKTLEEPPAHAVFIMATTELHKVPDTILSRVQQFDFKRANQKELLQNLQNIIEKEKLSVMPEALELIARAGDGSFRDSVSILDQIASLNEKEINVNHVKEILGLVPQNLLEDFVELLENRDAQGGIDLINQIYNEGYDLAQFNQTLIEELRDQMVKNSDYSKLEIIKKFITAGQDMKYAQIPQIPMEIAVVELMQNDELGIRNYGGDSEPKSQDTRNNNQTNSKLQIPNNKSIIENHSLKNTPLNILPQVNSGQVGTDRAKKSEIPDNLEVDSITATDDEAPIANLEVDNPVTNSQQLIANSESLIAKWPEIVGVVLANNQSLGTLLKDANALEIKDNKIVIGVKFKFYAERIMASDKITTVLDAIEKVLGDKLGVECVVNDNLEKVDRIMNQELGIRDGLETNNNEKTSNLINDALEVFGESE